MGVFDKIIGKIGNTFLKKIIIEHYNRFLVVFEQRICFI